MENGDSVFDDVLKQGLAVSLSQSPFRNLYLTPRLARLAASFATLKSYSEGAKIPDQKGDDAGLPLYQRAIE